MKKLKLAILLCFSLGMFIACDDDDGGSDLGMLNVEMNGLEPLASGYAYEGWVIVDGSPVSTGTFNVNENGSLTRSTFDVEESDLQNATMFVVSIEPVPDPDPAPAATKMLAGSFSGRSASLNTSIVGDFTNASGSFFLRTPTDESGMNNGNDENGVWFGIPGMPPTPDFNLPTLPEGWAYEGWVVGSNGPITTGTFTSFDEADQAAPYSGTAQSGPPVPGEDFFNNAPSGTSFPLDVRGRTVVISVEPVPDDSPAPFVMKPLLGTAGQATAPATHSLNPNPASLPTGTVSY